MSGLLQPPRLAELLASGAAVRVARLLSQGLSEEQAAESLRRRFPLAEGFTIYAALRRGEATLRAGNILSYFPGEGRVPLGDIPRGQNQQAPFTFYTRVTLPGGAEDAPNVRRVTVRSQSNLSYPELLAAAHEMVRETYGQRATRRGYEEYEPDFADESLVIEGIERA